MYVCIYIYVYIYIYIFLFTCGYVYTTSGDGGEDSVHPGAQADYGSRAGDYHGAPGLLLQNVFSLECVLSL